MCVWVKCVVGSQVCVWAKCVCGPSVCVWAKYVCGPSEIRISQNLGFSHIFFIPQVNSKPILTIFF